MTNHNEKLKFISWNVNGIRAILKKNFMDFFNEIDADFFCIQETKAKEEQVDLSIPNYFQYWFSAMKPGYSGVLILTKHEPLNIIKGIGVDDFDDEGRVLTLEFDSFYLTNIYSPNSQHGLKRLDFRMRFEDELLKFIKKLEEKKPVIYCGDLNVAHQEIDLKNPKNNITNPGFTKEERDKMTFKLNNGLVDIFRKKYPDKIKYSWWTYMFHARDKNIGWRIDYFICSKKLYDKVIDIDLLNEVYGSDHCPVYLEILKN